MKTYRTRNPRKSPLWQCVQRHHATLVEVYPRTYEPRHGQWPPVISDVFERFLHCGTLERGLPRVRCNHCAHEYLLAYSCKGRWFCPSCHQRKVESTAAHLVDHILLPVPHRHVVQALPRPLRPLFQRHRGLLRLLFTLGQQSIIQLLRSALDLPNSTPAFLVTLHTFGEYLDFHPHLHALVADGLSGLPRNPVRPPPEPCPDPIGIGGRFRRNTQSASKGPSAPLPKPPFIPLRRQPGIGLPKTPPAGPYCPRNQGHFPEPNLPNRGASKFQFLPIAGRACSCSTAALVCRTPCSKPSLT